MRNGRKREHTLLTGEQEQELEQWRSKLPAARQAYREATAAYYYARRAYYTSTKWPIEGSIPWGAIKRGAFVRVALRGAQRRSMVMRITQQGTYGGPMLDTGHVDTSMPNHLIACTVINQRTGAEGAKYNYYHLYRALGVLKPDHPLIEKHRLWKIAQRIKK